MINVLCVTLRVEQKKQVKTPEGLLSSLTLLMLSASPCLTKASFLSAGEDRHQCSACTKSPSSKKHRLLRKLKNSHPDRNGIPFKFRLSSAD
jgi:hypothetical protein